MALLPGVTGPGGGKFEAGLTELFRMGYYDERQNYEALEKSKGHVKAAAAFIRQGVVPDIEQGYESPTEAAPDRRLPTSTTCRPQIVNRSRSRDHPDHPNHPVSA